MRGESRSYGAEGEIDILGINIISIIAFYSFSNCFDVHYSKYLPAKILLTPSNGMLTYQWLKLVGHLLSYKASSPEVVRVGCSAVPGLRDWLPCKWLHFPSQFQDGCPSSSSHILTKLRSKEGIFRVRR